MADYPAFDGLGAKDRELHGGLGLTHGKHKSSFAEFDIDVYDIAEELAELLIRKHKDYGPANINNSPYGAIGSTYHKPD